MACGYQNDPTCRFLVVANDYRVPWENMWQLAQILVENINSMVAGIFFIVLFNDASQTSRAVSFT